MSRDPMSEIDCAILGAGASGILCALQLHRYQPGKRVLLIDSAGTWRGLAYRTPYDCHLLNVRAGNMSAFPDQPEHFSRWLAERSPAATRDTFAPRRRYGDYLEQLLELCCAEPGSRIERQIGTAVSLERVGGRWVVGLAGGRSVVAAAVVLALGNPAPGDHAWARGLTGAHYIPDPWALLEDRLQGRMDGGWRSGVEAPILLVGTGLTAVDVLLSLRADGYRGQVHAISRRGLLPRGHVQHPSSPVPGELSTGVPPAAPAASPAIFLKWLRAEIMRAERAGGDWRAVIDALRPHHTRIWSGWTEAEKRRFLRHLRPYWEVVRHRAAPEVAAAIDGEISAGTLVVHAGRIESLREELEGVLVRWRSSPRTRRSIPSPLAPHPGDSSDLYVQAVFNCTGPASDYSRVDHPLIAQLRGAGMLVPDPLGLGVETDAEGRMLDSAGRVIEGLWALGALRRAKLWESTAIPEIRTHAADLARRLGGG